LYKSSLEKLFCFYHEGFRNMSWWGKKVWIIILIKLFIIFILLRIFFFRDFLNHKYETEKQKSEYILDQLINSK